MAISPTMRQLPIRLTAILQQEPIPLTSPSPTPGEPTRNFGPIISPYLLLLHRHRLLHSPVHRSGTAPLDVSFTDSSTGTSITNRRWDFGTAISPTTHSTNPSHRYTSAGTYSVNLTVTNAGGANSQLRSNYISVSAAPPSAPVAAFTGTPLSGTAPLDVTFTDSSTGTSITNRRWDFGDGNISNYASATNPSHRYTSAGTYSVNLTVTNAGGSNSQHSGPIIYQ